MHTYPGTHYVQDISVTETQSNEVEVTTIYFEHSDAKGALFNFVYIDDRNVVDYTRSVLLALSTNLSYHYVLPFNLFRGHYRVLVFDIEHDGTLFSGVGYPAKVHRLSANKGGQGKYNPKLI